MSCHVFAAVPQFFGNDLPRCSVYVAIPWITAANRGIRSRQFSIALVGVLMPQAVARNAIPARDAAGAYHLVVMIFPFCELALGIHGARGARCAVGLRQVEQRTLFGREDRFDPISSTLGAVSDAEVGPPVGNVRAKLHSFPSSQPEGSLQFELQRDSRILLANLLDLRGDINVPS